MIEAVTEMNHQIGEVNAVEEAQ